MKSGRLTVDPLISCHLWFESWPIFHFTHNVNTDIKRPTNISYNACSLVCKPGGLSHQHLPYVFSNSTHRWKSIKGWITSSNINAWNSFVKSILHSISSEKYTYCKMLW
jgi:hypothetical protein